MTAEARTQMSKRFAPLSELQLYDAYSRHKPGTNQKESWDEVCDRVLHHPKTGVFALGQFTPPERQIIETHLRDRKAFGAARFLWAGGTTWLTKPENWHGIFNCTTRQIKEARDFGVCLGLSMQGCGVGAILEDRFISQLPPISTYLGLHITGRPGDVPKEKRREFTQQSVDIDNQKVYIEVGDSRQGWVSAYQAIIDIAMGLDPEVSWAEMVDIELFLGHVRPEGSKIEGFGGVANPTFLDNAFTRIISVLNDALERQLTSVECCKLIDWMQMSVEAGGVRRSAGMRQFSSEDESGATAKIDLWTVSEDGAWRIDPERECLTMANHTRAFHHKPSYDEVLDSIRLQLGCGEGAIQYAPEAIARGNADILSSTDKPQFIALYESDPQHARDFLEVRYQQTYTRPCPEEELDNRMTRYGLNPCGELIASDNHCNLASVALSNLSFDRDRVKTAFKASALQACISLGHNFLEERFAYSWAIDPVVIVSFTSGFEWFARYFGINWLRWWAAGRPATWNAPNGEELPKHVPTVEKAKSHADIFLAVEQQILSEWRDTVRDTIYAYCDRNNLKRPNRYTGLKPEGSLTLLTAVGCNGIHPPKSWHYIRRKTVRAGSPIGKAALDYGFSVVPGQSDKDESGNLLEDPFDPRCSKWLIEVPVQERLVTIFPQLIDEQIDPIKFSALAQFNWLMQVQAYYTTHNSSFTLEPIHYEQDEGEEMKALAKAVHEAIQLDRGYISMAILARNFMTFPRMPFEPVSRDRYEELQSLVLSRRKTNDFLSLVNTYQEETEWSDTAACSSEACEATPFPN